MLCITKKFPYVAGSTMIPIVLSFDDFDLFSVLINVSLLVLHFIVVDEAWTIPVFSIGFMVQGLSHQK